MHDYRIKGEIVNSRDYAAVSEAIMGLIHARPAAQRELGLERTFATGDD